jgi:hypothetical protein
VRIDRTFSRWAFAIVSLFSVLLACPASATKYKAPASEVVLLPQFCWAQYMENVEGPDYSISSTLCGVGMNHYCPALIELIEAKRSIGSKARDRPGHLNVARKEVLYTLNAMREYPSCPIRSHAESSLKEIEVMQKALPPR